MSLFYSRPCAFLHWLNILIRFPSARWRYSYSLRLSGPLHRNRIAIRKFASHIVHRMQHITHYSTYWIVLLSTLSTTQHNATQKSKGTGRILQHCLPTIWGSFDDNDDDAPFEKLSRSFHCKRVKKFKWFWHILSGTISIVITIINFLSLMHCCFFFLVPFFSTFSSRHVSVCFIRHF